jgi:exodeoxyribonuclease VII large subunit
MAMIVRGRVTVYDQRGDYQLIVEYLEPRGIGALQLAFIQLKEKLAKEGLFGDDRKQPIPQLPQRIGIVTSPTGAAIHDILQVLNRRFANVEVLIRPVKVQGEGAAEEIAEAIADFNRYREIDVMIVGRGGGSLEDLWAFNEEVVARAVARSKIPVISAVGHEVDFTIADFVADLRAPTPSAAAELVVQSKEELAARLAFLRHRIQQGMQRELAERFAAIDGLARSLRDPSLLLGHLAQRVDDLAERLGWTLAGSIRHRLRELESLRTHLRLTNPALEVERGRERLLGSIGRLQTVIRRMLDRHREGAAVATGRLEALSPLSTLARGYSITLKLPGRVVVRESNQVTPGDRVELRFHRGRATCLVESGGD